MMFGWPKFWWYACWHKWSIMVIPYNTHQPSLDTSSGCLLDEWKTQASGNYGCDWHLVPHPPCVRCGPGLELPHIRGTFTITKQHNLTIIFMSRSFYFDKKYFMKETYCGDEIQDIFKKSLVMTKISLLWLYHNMDLLCSVWRIQRKLFFGTDERKF